MLSLLTFVFLVINQLEGIKNYDVHSEAHVYSYMFITHIYMIGYMHVHRYFRVCNLYIDFAVDLSWQ